MQGMHARGHMCDQAHLMHVLLTPAAFKRGVRRPLCSGLHSCQDWHWIGGVGWPETGGVMRDQCLRAGLVTGLALYPCRHISISQATCFCSAHHNCAELQSCCQ